MRIIFTFLSGLLLLTGCVGSLDMGPGLPVVSSLFSEAMRWQDYPGAANYLQEDLRGDFLDQFQQDEDLRVVESRIYSVELNAETKIAEAVYRMEYYRLPSMRVKKWQWSQQWQLQEQKALKSAIWQIINPPPPLP